MRPSLALHWCLALAAAAYTLVYCALFLAAQSPLTIAIAGTGFCVAGLTTVYSLMRLPNY